jgi:prophage regulatory protein
MQSQPTAPSAPLQVLRLPQVRKVTGLCRSMIYQLEGERKFPRRVKIGMRAVGWIDGEVQEWLKNRIERSRGGSGHVVSADYRQLANRKPREFP